MSTFEDDDYPPPPKAGYTDNTIMPFGKHKGKMLSQVPADYLLWLYNDSQLRGTSLDTKLKAYIEEKTDSLHEESKIKKQ